VTTIRFCCFPPRSEVISQLPIEHWHEAIGDPTLADAILDRLVHNAHRLPFTGESLRKRAATRKRLDPTHRALLPEPVGQPARGGERLPTMPWNRCPSSVEDARLVCDKLFEGLDAERRDGHGLSLVGVVDPEDPNLGGI
jgi:hypothetical protein